MKDLTPLSRASIKIGEELKFPIFGEDGQLLLAAGHVVQSEKQLDELANKGLYQNPQWADRIAQSRMAAGTVVPTAELRTTSKKSESSDPSESGNVLKMNVKGSEESFIVKLVGTINRDAFVITHPSRDGGLVYIKEGLFWEFRAFYGTSVYKFEAKVDKAILAPHALLVMAWPNETQLESKVIRATRRVSCDIPASLHSAASVQGQPVHGTINNISTGGVEFATRHKMKVGKGDRFRLAFQITLGERKYLLNPEVQVMSLAREESDPHLRLGLSFEALSDLDYATIHAYVDRKVIQRIESPLYSR